MKKSEVIDMLEDVVVLIKGDGSCDDLISAVRYAIAVIQGGTSDAINRDKALNLVLDVCNDVMDECETVTGTCGEEVYTDAREVDAILKCNKRIRNGIRQLPSEQLRPKGEWVYEEINSYTDRTYCPECGSQAPFVYVADDYYGRHAHGETRKTNFCPNCGADLRTKESNDV